MFTPKHKDTIQPERSAMLCSDDYFGKLDIFELNCGEMRNIWISDKVTEISHFSNSYFLRHCVNKAFNIQHSASGTVNSKSFVGKVLLRIKWKFELTYAL